MWEVQAAKFKLLWSARLQEIQSVNRGVSRYFCTTTYLTCLSQHSLCVRGCQVATELPPDARCSAKRIHSLQPVFQRPQHRRSNSLVVRDPAPDSPLRYNVRFFSSCNVQDRQRLWKESIARFNFRNCRSERLRPSTSIIIRWAPTRARALKS